MAAPSAAERLVVENYAWARRTACSLTYRMSLRSAEEDLTSVAFEALWKCAREWDPTRGIEFKPYTRIRIKWALIDYSRAATGLARNKGSGKLPGRAIRIPSASLRHSEDRLENSETYWGLDSRLPLPDEALEKKRRAARIKRIVNGLPRNLARVVHEYYWRDRSLKEIGALLGVTESRVCQLLRQATEQLGDRMDPGEHAP